RVTGGTSSHINGLLRSTIPNADFYFLNPAGVMFGKHAQLDVQGAFYLSTADYLRLDDGGQFSATQPEKSLLTVAPPAAFGFLEPNYAPITLQDSELRVLDNQTFSLVAGDISLTKSGVYAPDGQIQVASVASQGEVGVKLNEVNLDIFQRLGTIRLTDSRLGNKVRGFKSSENNWNGSQGIYILGGQFFSDNSTLNAKALQEMSRDGDGIVINSRETVTLTNRAILSTDSFSTTDAGDITIRTNHLTMQDRATLISDTQKGGTGGVITIEAKQLIMNDNASIGSNTSGQGGPGGHILVSADVFQMQDDTTINATTRGTDSPAGQIMITITDDFQMAGDATINTGAYSDVYYEGTGKSGQVKIEAKTVSLTDTARIISTSFTGGQSGSLFLVADNFFLSKQSAVATTTFSQGKGGDVNVQVRHSFSLTDEAVIVSGTEGGGASGDILLLIQADRVAISNVANISSDSVMENAFINETRRLLDIAEQQGAEINDSVFVGGGKPGQVYIKTDRLFLDSSINPLAEKWQFEQCEKPTQEESHLKVEMQKVPAETVIYDIFFDQYD
ncbi:MAG TPA: filamentous hemagglutinin N-terminal domain-containing protein, partial [Thioploca sp.]|nr:filamentous hemagglutinin N-terminal domain-containing protein [Thioploca sp.]